MTAASTRDEPLLNQLVAGQAKAQQQFEELFRRLDRAETTAGEARDTAKELVTILREQDTGARLTEMRVEQRDGLAALRTDVVAANTRIRTDLDTETKARRDADDAIDIRLLALEAERNKVVGVAGFFSWLAKVAPWLLAGIAAFLAGSGLKNGG
ncbi:hypothetical protein BH09PSE1_BH09PSE1_23420 [soil metagenome]